MPGRLAPPIHEPDVVCPGWRGLVVDGSGSRLVDASALPEKVRVMPVTGLFPVFFIVVLKTVAPSVDLTRSMDSTCTCALDAIVPAVLKKTLYVSSPPAIVIAMRTIVARIGLMAFLSCRSFGLLLEFEVLHRKHHFSYQ